MLLMESEIHENTSRRLIVTEKKTQKTVAIMKREGNKETVTNTNITPPLNHVRR